ncbi:hypothetical protein LTS18_012700 [Coniosporium uncinatum]|uniref:Uncharacterized protein n=1 Tax=Coniosporium uncinatum TaxID=93489 RepID=A0ACC3DJ89_9PEZI|nr:hypothetical protein LTS18_012700 [Coniosporium uncinatum]
MPDDTAMSSSVNHYEALGLPADAESPAIEHACKTYIEVQEPQHNTFDLRRLFDADSGLLSLALARQHLPDPPKDSHSGFATSDETPEQTQHLSPQKKACTTLLSRWTKSRYDGINKSDLDAYTAKLTLSRTVAAQKAARVKLFDEATACLNKGIEEKLAAVKQTVEHFQFVFPPGSDKRNEANIWLVELIPRAEITTFELQQKQVTEVGVLIKLERAWMSLMDGEREGYVVEDVVKKWDEFVRVRGEREEAMKRAVEGRSVSLMEERVTDQSAKGVAEALEAAVGDRDGRVWLGRWNSVSVGLVNVVVVTWLIACLRIWWRTWRASSS